VAAAIRADEQEVLPAERPERSQSAILCSQTELFAAGSTVSAILWLRIVRSPPVSDERTVPRSRRRRKNGDYRRVTEILSSRLAFL
jgi:hypothetical protein